jgi:hypothetical protein
MARTGSHDQDLAFANCGLAAIDTEPQRALQDVDNGLVRVRVERDHGPFLEVHLRQQQTIPNDGFPGDHFGHLFKRHVLPAIKRNQGIHAKFRGV